MSAKRQRDAREYARLRAEFLKAHPFCQVWLARHRVHEEHARGLRVVTAIGAHGVPWPVLSADIPRSTDIHHKAGRTGSNYLDTSTWMAVSRAAHDWIHTHPKEARARGWLV